jgi:hypothetical protein
MRITKHITFFYIENRINYINRIISEVNNYPFVTDIYIHTNINFRKELLINNLNGKIQIIVHDMLNEHPYYLTWKCRPYMKEQLENYDLFIYVEDDMLFPKEALNYWLEVKDTLLEKNYNLGFIRIETNTKGEEYVTDLMLPIINNNNIVINNCNFVNNNIQTYCACWIYDKSEFTKWINSSYYNILSMAPYFNDREGSAIGLNSPHITWYKSTILPINNNNKLDPRIRIYHLANNYVDDQNTKLAKIKFSEILLA